MMRGENSYTRGFYTLVLTLLRVRNLPKIPLFILIKNIFLLSNCRIWISVYSRNMWEEGIWSEYKKDHLFAANRPSSSIPIRSLLSCPWLSSLPARDTDRGRENLRSFWPESRLMGSEKIFLISYYYLSTEYFDYAIMYLNCLDSFAVKI